MTTETRMGTNVEGREMPRTGRWTIDPAHSSIELVARHMMISKVRGRFRDFSGVIVVADPPERSWAEVTIRTSSIDTGDEGRDRHLRSADFLNVEQYPEARFRSTAVRPAPRDHWQVDGELTILDMTRPITLDVEYCGMATDPWGGLRAGFLASTEINREEFAITWNQALETGGFLVGKGVKVEADIEAVWEGDADE